VGREKQGGGGGVGGEGEALSVAVLTSGPGFCSDAPSLMSVPG
jgi:hypothetical protein